MPAQYAPVAPLSGLRQLDEAGELGHYQLLIAPIILQREASYRDFFLNHDDQFVIVDNGVIELGYPLEIKALYRAIRVVDAQLLVLPDTIDDGKMTAKQVRRALPLFRQLDTTTDVMGVIQGTTFAECMECARIMVQEGVDWLAVPRGLTPNLGTRIDLVRAVGDEFKKPIHILGFSDNMSDDIQATVAHPLVRGIDNATPLWYRGSFPAIPPVEANRTMRIGRRPRDFWYDPASPDAVANVRVMRNWLQHASAWSTVPTAPTGEPEPAPLKDQ